MTTLSDLNWSREDGKWIARSAIKTAPAIHVLMPAAKYAVSTCDGRVYEGRFAGYRYEKEAMSSNLCRAYLEFVLDIGNISLDDTLIERIVQKGTSDFIRVTR